jgi:imidazolonepropionase-like amidohydrolase
MPDAVVSMSPSTTRLTVGLLIEGDRIATIGPDATVPRPEHARQIALPEATALPGLLDAHVHITFAGDIDPLGTMARETDEELIHRGLVNAERMVRGGVTTIFECGARNSTGFGVQRAIERRQGLGPRILASGRPVTRRRGHCHWLNGEAEGEQGVRTTIRRLIEEEGAGGIKMMATGGGMTTGTDSRFAAYPVEILAAAADEAHRLGRIITTHAHGVPGIRNATQAGIDGIQHATMMGDDWTWQFDEDVARQMVERGTVACATIGAGIRVQLEAGVDINNLNPNPGKALRPEWLANGEALRRAGVKMVAATDVGVTFTDFGEELFFELEMYVRIGWTPLEAIRAATSNSAAYMGLQNETGRLAPGLAADIYVVNGRPDETITDLRKGAIVFKQGQLIQATPAPDSPPWPTSGPLARFTMERTPAAA